MIELGMNNFCANRHLTLMILAINIITPSNNSAKPIALGDIPTYFRRRDTDHIPPQNLPLGVMSGVNVPLVDGTIKIGPSLVNRSP
ncbi:hypothetical protein [Nocardia carnea]|uniref:hypothetical protein n=1 Tax=Nocardia carnea TaxID=37328 RepID=UPI0024575E98|nr:hypothetical protein [Nocardia carnea]